MRLSIFTTISALTLASLVSAQIPQCVITCSMQAASTAGCSSYTDITCVCTNADFQNAAGACLVANCTTAEQEAGLALQTTLCQGQSLTSGSVTATVASGSASISLDTASIAAITASGSSALTSAASSIAASASSSAGAASGSHSASGASGASASAVSATSKAASAASSAAAAATSSKGGAGRVEFGLKGMGATVVGVIGVLAGGFLVL